MADVTRFSDRLLRKMGVAWFAVAVVGQGIFIAYILAFYGPRTASGDYAAWNDRQLIMGYAEGDGFGNFMFAVHVFLAAVMTFGGVLQLLPALRRRMPAVHRWNGRLFLLTSLILAIGGMWMATIRGASLSWQSELIISMNAVLIIIFAGYTVRHAVARNIAVHERWAMRLFMVANGVWFFRLTLMAWVLINQGPVGMNASLSGPGDIAAALGSYVLPLVGLEIYQAGKRSNSALVKMTVVAVTVVFIGLTALGIGGATAFMWLPSLT